MFGLFVSLNDSDFGALVSGRGCGFIVAIALSSRSRDVLVLGRFVKPIEPSDFTWRRNKWPIVRSLTTTCNIPVLRPIGRPVTRSMLSLKSDHRYIWQSPVVAFH